jgi:hypothetical protein
MGVERHGSAGLDADVQRTTLYLSMAGLHTSSALPLLSYTMSNGPSGRLASSAGLPQLIVTPSDASLSYWLYGSFAFALDCVRQCIVFSACYPSIYSAVGMASRVLRHSICRGAQAQMASDQPNVHDRRYAYAYIAHLISVVQDRHRVAVLQQPAR